jgi:DNA polymerase
MEAEEAADAVAKTLGSAVKFGALLKDLGVEVPTKISPTTGKEAPALAKTDEAFLALQDHPDPLVATAAKARLGVKSTLLETRIEAFLEAAGAAGGKLPVPLKYSGADTTRRWSGWGYNPQNLPRVSGKLSDALRNSLVAPKGYKVVVADLSGIELRVNHFLWKVPSSMALFQADPEKADLYKDFASRLYGVDVAEVSKPQRQVGKVAHLGLGFGAGPVTFQKVAKLMAGIDLAEADAAEVVYKWRDEYPQIVQGWKDCHDALPIISEGADGFSIDPWGMCVPAPDGIRTPCGLIRYPSLRREIGEDGKKEWWYGEGRHKARIYAGKITENVVQALARDVIAGNTLEIHRVTGYRPALLVHDEWVGVVPESEAEAVLAEVQHIMRTPPPWWPELVTWSEGDIADTYGAAK